MKLRLTARGVDLSSELREYVQRRVHFSLGRFAPRIRSVSIRLTDVNGPRGGADKCCLIRLHSGLKQEVIVHERHANIYAAAAIAIERVQRSFVRQLGLEAPAKR
jgi:ribosome-associated translation inhibitor RaiA